MKNIPEELVDLMSAVLLYIDVRGNKPNPFVKSFKGSKEEDEAYTIMIECLNGCENYFPEIDKLNKQRISAFIDED